MRKAGMDKCTAMPCWAYKCIWLWWHSEAQVGQDFFGMGLRSMTIPALLLPLLLVTWDPPSHVLAHSGSSMVPSGNETACVQANGACHAHVHQRAGCSSASADCTTAHVPIATCVSASVPLFSPSARGPGGGLRPIGHGGPAAAALHAGPDGGRRRYGCMAGRWRARRRQMAPRHWPTSACTCRCNCKLWGVLSVYSHTQLSSGHTRRYAMHATLHTQLKLVHQQFILHNCTTEGSMKGHVMDADYRVMATE